MLIVLIIICLLCAFYLRQVNAKQSNNPSHDRKNSPINDADTTLSLYNQKFKNTLAGKWVTKEGTFFLIYDELNFFENGLGTWYRESGSGKMTTYFNWKIAAPFSIEIIENHVETSDEDEYVDEDGEEESTVAELINYEFKKGNNDVSQEIFLCAKNSDYFYRCNTRIGLCKDLGV